MKCRLPSHARTSRAKLCLRIAARAGDPRRIRPKVRACLESFLHTDRKVFAASARMVLVSGLSSQHPVRCPATSCATCETARQLVRNQWLHILRENEMKGGVLPKLRAQHREERSLP